MSMSPLSRSLNQIALDDLHSTICACGQNKASMQSFCRRCYFALPTEMRKRLYTLMPEYAGIYDEAKDWLRINTNAQIGRAS